MFNFIPRWKKLFIFLSAIVITVIPLAAGMVSAEAEDASDSNQSEEAVSTEALEKEIKKLEKKLDNLRDKKSTLQSELDYADNQIYLTQLRVQSVQNQINAAKESIEKLVLDIENLTNRLEKIKESIEYQENLLNQRKREYYKIDQTTPKGIEFLLFLIEPSELDKKIQKITYSQIMQERDKNLLDEMNKTKYAYANQKDIFEDKKGEEEQLKAEVERQKTVLDQYSRDLEEQKAAKQRLLADTQNDESKYQALLEQARITLESYKSFVQTAGGGVVGPNGLGGGKDGWYYSQRDSRWADEKIGNSSYTVFESGCLVTSVAMVHKYYGYDATPAQIAEKDDHFFYGDMRIPWPAPSGRSYKVLAWGYPKESIDKELSNKNPVIVGVRAGNAAGTHFIVLIKKDDDGYVMHDPYYGPDLDFSDYYSTSSIFEAVVFK